MSARYGRNKRRKHLNEIALLKAELHLAITGGYQPATGKHRSLDKLVAGYLEVDVRETEDERSIRREATIRLIPTSPDELKAMLYHSAYSGYVEWRGIVWAIMMPHIAEFDVHYYGSEIVTIELRAIGARDSNRKPVCYPANTNITRQYDFIRHRRNDLDSYGHRPSPGRA